LDSYSLSADQTAGNITSTRRAKAPDLISQNLFEDLAFLGTNLEKLYPKAVFLTASFTNPHPHAAITRVGLLPTSSEVGNADLPLISGGLDNTGHSQKGLPPFDKS
jgi:hypothetical protein